MKRTTETVCWRHPGDTMTLGIRRGEQLQLTSFVKMDPKDMPKDRKIIMKKRD